MHGFVEQCVELYLELTGRHLDSLKEVPTPSIDVAQLPEEDFVEKGVLAPFAAKILMKILFAARMYRYDLLCAVGSLAREITRWSRACDKRLHRLVCYVNSTKTTCLCGTVGDAIDDCRLVLFADADFAGDHSESKSTPGMYLAMVGRRTFVPLQAISKAQSAVSHSSTEAEVISLEFAHRTEGVPALLFLGFVAPYIGFGSSGGPRQGSSK